MTRSEVMNENDGTVKKSTAQTLPKHRQHNDNSLPGQSKRKRSRSRSLPRPNTSKSSDKINGDEDNNEDESIDENGSNVKVAVRIRPLINKENLSGSRSIVDKTPNEQQVVVRTGKPSECFTFDRVFGEDDDQNTIYRYLIKSVIPKLFKGYNVTILAYGQTGSGKTHTMGTNYNGVDSDVTGIIPRAVEQIFDYVKQHTDINYKISCSFVELYRERLYDLLSDKDRTNTIIEIREDNKKGIVLPNLTEIPVNKHDEALDCLSKASSRRAVGSTAMNLTSSRSHAIFTINVEVAEKTNPIAATKAKFHLVDLAGSERSNKTKTSGERFEEGVKINQGLLALGNVISALGSAQVHSHIGYRDSKLTRMLQDSLGGNAFTIMIACVSPADDNLEETLGTLRYANRAKQIKNKPIVNEDPKAAEIKRLQNIVTELQSKLQAEKEKNAILKKSLTASRRLSAMPFLPSESFSAGDGSINNVAGTMINNVSPNRSTSTSLKLNQHSESQINRPLNGSTHEVNVTEKAKAQLAVSYSTNTSNSGEMINGHDAGLINAANDYYDDGLNAAIDECDEESNSYKIITKLSQKLGMALQEFAFMEDRLQQCEVDTERQHKTVKELQNKIKHINEDVLDTFHCNVIKEIKELIGDLESSLLNCTYKSCQINVNAAEKSLTKSSELDGQTKDTMDTELIDFTNRQEKYFQDLRQLKVEIALKEELQRKLNGNLNSMNSIECQNDLENKMKEYETLIAKYEEERERLLQDAAKYKSSSTKSKLAEERRKQIQNLEQKIAELKKQNTQQSLMLRAREKDQRKISEMGKDLDHLKQMKVKLVRTMKSESEQFRQWKLCREKELCQLRNKDRKRENELRRKEMEYQKKETFLKRKVEEAFAVNKRLKDVLEKNKNVAASKKFSSTRFEDEILPWIENEVEVIVSVIDAKHALESLLKQRGIVNMQMLNLKKSGGTAKQLAELQQDLDLRNAQIADLQDKIKSTSIDSKIKSMLQNLNNVQHAKAAVKSLVAVLQTIRQKHLSKFNKYQDICLSYETLKEEFAEIEQKHRHELEQLKSEQIRAEQEYEDKVSVLLRQLSNTGTMNQDSKMIQDDALDNLREKLKMYENQFTDLNSKMRKKVTRNLKRQDQRTFSPYCISSDDDDGDDYIDNTEDDPDWVQTPRVRLISRRKRPESDSFNSATGTNDTAEESKILNLTTVISNHLGKNKSSDKFELPDRHTCQCKKNCKRTCGCRKAGLSCVEKCHCNNKCCNGNSTIDSSNGSQNISAGIENVDTTNTDYQSPKKFRIFNEMDSTSPYPYENKKRKPLLPDKY